MWDAIATRHIDDGTRSATGAMRDAYRSRDADLARATARLRYPDDEPVGVVALGPTGALCADVFDRPGTLRAYWARLVRSYFLDAAGAEHVPAGAAGGAGSPEASAAALLARERMRRWTPTRRPAWGATSACGAPRPAPPSCTAASPCTRRSSPPPLSADAPGGAGAARPVRGPAERRRRFGR